MADDDEKHLIFPDYPACHKPSSDWDQGACLTRHEYSYKEFNSCSHRWQAYMRAEDDDHVYNSHSDANCHIGGSCFRYISQEAINRGDSNLFPGTRTGKTSTKTYTKKNGTKVTVKTENVKVKNFTTGGAPYPNQAHHIIPNAELRNSIVNTAISKAELIEAIAKGLLEEKYNLNCKINMIILPTEWKNACQIGLPTHNGSHPNFSENIAKEVIRALSPYQKAADKGEEHKKIILEKIKKNLEDISNNMHDKLIADSMRNKIQMQCDSDELKINTIPKSLFKKLF